MSPMSLNVSKLQQLMNRREEEFNKPNIQLCAFTYLKISHQMSCIFHFVDSFVRVFFFSLSVLGAIFFLAGPEPL